MTDRSHPSFDALDQRVLGLEKDVTELGRKFDNGFAAIRSDFATAINAINTKLDARSDSKWIWAPLIGGGSLILAVVGGLGTLSLNPVKDQVVLLEAARLRTEQDSITRDRRVFDIVLQMKGRLDYIEGQLHPLK